MSRNLGPCKIENCENTIRFRTFTMPKQKLETMDYMIFIVILKLVISFVNIIIC